MSIVGVIFLLALGYLCSSNRKAISWRTVGGAFLIQVILAVFVLATPWGVSVLQWLTMRVSELIGAGEERDLFFVWTAIRWWRGSWLGLCV
jgi:CNT family concentrative nucleoside transporter